MYFEEEVIEILNRWLKNCKIRFYFVPMDCCYHCTVYFQQHNIFYNSNIPYAPDMDAKKVTHHLLQDITHNILNYFFKED